VAQEPEGSSPHSQQPVTGPCPEPIESNPPPPQANLPKIHSDPIFPPTPWSSNWSLSFELSHQNLVHLSLLSHACHMSRPSHVKWVHCHHGMARPRVADRGDGLQIWRVAANILNKQSRTADSGWFSSLGVGRGANNPSP
jgi:hypothetical protein